MIKKMNEECNNVGTSVPYLPKMYDFRFFYINLLNFSYPRLLEYLLVMSHDNSLSYLSISQMHQFVEFFSILL